MDIEIALLEFENATTEVKDAAAKYKAAWLRQEKAKVQKAFWLSEIKISQDEFQKAKDAFHVAVKSWDPAGAKKPVPVELPADPMPVKPAKTVK